MDIFIIFVYSCIVINERAIMAKFVKFKTVHSIAQMAYLAGLIDGEGCFYIGHFKTGNYGTGMQWHSLLKVTSCDEVIIIWLEQNFGGCRESRYRWTSKKKFTRPVYGWQVTGKMLDYLLPNLLPFLVIKKQHCELMIEYRATNKNIGSHRLTQEVIDKRLVLLKRLRNLNSRFHDHPLKNPSPLSP